MSLKRKAADVKACFDPPNKRAKHADWKDIMRTTLMVVPDLTAMTSSFLHAPPPDIVIPSNLEEASEVVAQFETTILDPWKDDKKLTISALFSWVSNAVLGMVHIGEGKVVDTIPTETMIILAHYPIDVAFAWAFRAMRNCLHHALEEHRRTRSDPLALVWPGASDWRTLICALFVARQTTANETTTVLELMQEIHRVHDVNDCPWESGQTAPLAASLDRDLKIMLPKVMLNITLGFAVTVDDAIRALPDAGERFVKRNTILGQPVYATLGKIQENARRRGVSGEIVLDVLDMNDAETNEEAKQQYKERERQLMHVAQVATARSDSDLRVGAYWFTAQSWQVLGDRTSAGYLDEQARVKCVALPEALIRGDGDQILALLHMFGASPSPYSNNNAAQMLLAVSGAAASIADDRMRVQRVRWTTYLSLAIVLWRVGWVTDFDWNIDLNVGDSYCEMLGLNPKCLVSTTTSEVLDDELTEAEQILTHELYV